MIRYNYWIYKIVCFLFHEKVVYSYALFASIQNHGVISSMPSQTSRRGFLGTIAVISTMTSISQVSAAETGSNLKNYEYSSTWIGTSLEIISAQDAANWKDDCFPFGRWPDPILRRKASSVDFRQIKRTDLEKICLKLRNTARDKGAVGLAAQQW